MATNAFMSGFGKATGGGKKKKDDDDDDSKQSGSASAFQAGFGAGQARRKAGKAKSTLKKAQNSSGPDLMQSPVSAVIPSMKHGGRVKKTGLIYAHRGETVIPVRHHAKTSRRKPSTRIKA